MGTYLIDDVSIVDLDAITATSTEIASSINMYPNPAADVLFIETQGMGLSLDSYKIVSLEGRTVRAGVLAKGRIDISEINAGLYYVVLETDKGNTALRFMKD